MMQAQVFYGAMFPRQAGGEPEAKVKYSICTQPRPICVLILGETHVQEVYLMSGAEAANKEASRDCEPVEQIGVLGGIHAHAVHCHLTVLSCCQAGCDLQACTQAMTSQLPPNHQWILHSTSSAQLLPGWL